MGSLISCKSMWDIEFDRANILAVWRQVAETTHETYRVFDPDEQIQIPPMDADLFTETSLASSEWVVQGDRMFKRLEMRVIVL